MVSRPSRHADISRLFGGFRLDAAAVIADTSADGRQLLIDSLVLAAGRYHRLGLADHWSYDPSIHAAMLRLIKAEQAELDRLRTMLVTEV